MNHRHWPLTLLSASLLSMCVVAARADIVILKSQGQVQGEIQRSEDPQQTTLKVKLDAGGTITIEKSQIKSLIPQNPAEKEYAEKAPGYADTVEAQWELSEWCREHSLGELRTAHLERVIE